VDGENLSSPSGLPSNGQTLLLVCGVDKTTSGTALHLTETTKVVRAFVGVHPSEAPGGQALGWLEEALKKATGAGEIGLDPKYSATGPQSAQRAVFVAQLEAAEHQNKPVQVHSRNAEGDCLDTLGGFSLKSVLMHWFQEERYISEVLRRGYFVSFGPALLYSKKLQRMATRCDRGQVLTETDSPVAYRPLGEVHGPFLVPSVVFRLAELWRVPFEEARAAIVENNMRYLGEFEKG
jgi:TatD DNase family protein